MAIVKKTDNETALSPDINVITAEINAYQRVAGEAIFEIGMRMQKVRDEKLVEKKDGWNAWCENDLGMTRRYANMFVKVADELSGSGKSISHIGIAALYQIATMPEESRTQPHTIPSTGATKAVDDMTVKELREVKKALKEAEAQRGFAEREADILRDTLESIEDKEPEVRYVEIDRTKPDIEKRLEMYEEKFGDISNYSDRHSATNIQEVTTSVMSFSKAVRDLAKRHAYLIQYQHTIGSLDELTREEYNEAVQALSDLTRDFKTVDKGNSVIDAEYTILNN